MWEVLGWVAVACLCVVMLAVTVLVVVSLVREIRSPGGSKSKRVI